MQIGIFRILSIVLMQLPGCAASAENIVCQSQSWFTASNDQGAAAFSFSFDFEEVDGALKKFSPSGFNCERFDSVQFNASEIYIACSREPLAAAAHWGRFEVVTKIDRNSGYMSQFHAFEKKQDFTIYEGYCRSAARKF